MTDPSPLIALAGVERIFIEGRRPRHPGRHERVAGSGANPDTLMDKKQ